MACTTSSFGALTNKCDPRTVVKYIGCYLGRPVIAASRIDKYDGGFVTFHYNQHEDGQYVEETIPVMEFMERLIQHIPEKHYKMIRYGGIYARHWEIDKKLHRAIPREKHHVYRNFDMDYFLNEDDPFDDDFGEEGFYIF